jgi:FAD-dependent urate hydroxylase
VAHGPAHRGGAESPSEALATVAIIGAGPHGLSVAAHLESGGVETTVFGSPMAFWATQMPAGMLLRSAWRASSIASPGGRLTLEAYEDREGVRLDRPIRLDDYVRYGRWFAANLAARVVPRRVSAVHRAGEGFHLTLDDGARCEADFVVVAAGIDRFPHIPQRFGDLPPEFASHSVKCRTFDSFSGRRVVVIGGGQSALEHAALLREAGATVTVIARASTLRWIGQPGSRRHLTRALHAAMHPPTGVGPRGLNWVAALPDVFRPLPCAARVRAMRRCLRPIGAPWLRSRLADVTCKLSCEVHDVAVDRGTVKLRVSDGSTLEADHIVLATGYRIDIRRYTFLAPDLLSSVQQVAGFPVLRAGLESSVPGLHFVGAPASLSFGPVMRFVVGSWYAGSATADRILGRRSLGLRRAYR